MDFITFKDLFTLIILLLALLLLLRSFLIWYWKIDKQIELQEENNQLLKELLSTLTQNNKGKESPIQERKVTDQTSVNDPEVLASIIDKLKGNT